MATKHILDSVSARTAFYFGSEFRIRVYAPGDGTRRLYSKPVAISNCKPRRPARRSISAAYAIRVKPKNQQASP